MQSLSYAQGGTLKLSKQSKQLLADAATSELRVFGEYSSRPCNCCVGYVNHFLEEPWKDHLAAAKRILRYVVGTSNWGSGFAQRRKIRCC
jgi:hypothetical protein